MLLERLSQTLNPFFQQSAIFKLCRKARKKEFRKLSSSIADHPLNNEWNLTTNFLVANSAINLHKKCHFVKEDTPHSHNKAGLVIQGLVA